MRGDERRGEKEKNSRRLRSEILACWSGAYQGQTPGWASNRGSWVSLAALTRKYDDPEILRRWTLYLREPGDFFKGHPLTKFCQQFDRWASRPVPVLNPTKSFKTERAEKIAKLRGDFDLFVRAGKNYAAREVANELSKLGVTVEIPAALAGGEEAR